MNPADELRRVCAAIDDTERTRADLYGARRLLVETLRQQGWTRRQIQGVARVADSGWRRPEPSPAALVDRCDTAETLLVKLVGQYGWPTDVTTRERVLLELIGAASRR